MGLANMKQLGGLHDTVENVYNSIINASVYTHVRIHRYAYLTISTHLFIC